MKTYKWKGKKICQFYRGCYQDQIHQNSVMFLLDANGQWITKTDHIRDIHINDQENLVSNSILWKEKSSGISWWMCTSGHRLALGIMFVNIYISLRNFNTGAITFEFQAAFGMMYTLFCPHEASSDLLLSK